MSGLKTRIVKDSMLFSASRYVYYILKIISSVVIRRVLGPALMGSLSILFLIIEYAKSSHLGILNALDREIPYYRGKDDNQKVEEIKDVSFNFYFASVIVAAFFIVGAFFCLRQFRYHDIHLLQGLIIVPLLLIVYMFAAYYLVFLRAQHRFNILSRYNIILTIAEVAATVILVILWGVKGVVLAMAIAFAAGAIYLAAQSNLSLRINPLLIKMKELLRLLKIGVPLIVYDFVRTLFLSIDKIMIIFLLGRTQLGLYSVATMAFNFLMPLPRAVYNVLCPRFYEAYGRNENIDKIKQYLITPTLIFAYLFSIIIGVAIIFLSPFIYYILPRYVNGIMAVNILLLSTFFYSLIFMWGYFLIAIYKQIRMVQFNLVAIIIAIVLNYLFVTVFKLGITGIALATTITYAVLSTIFISHVFSYYSKDIKDHLVLFVKFYFPFCWVLAILLILKSNFSFTHSSLLSDFSKAAGLSSIFITCCLPLVFYVNKKSQIVNLILQSLRKNRIENAQDVKL